MTSDAQELDRLFARKALGEIRVVLAEPSPALRAELAETLRREGFQNIFATGNLLAVMGAVADGDIDLLIGDTILPEGDLSRVVKQIRHGDIGDNPFLVVIALISNPTSELVRRVIDSGPDDVLVKPFTREQFRDRILSLSRGRRPFVVTTDYIGPDRRTKPRPGAMVIPLVPVPNPLKARLSAGLDAAALKRAIAATTAKINEQKVERHAYQIGYLVDRIVPSFADGRADEDTMTMLRRLQWVSADISRRLKGTRYAHAAGLCLSLDQLAGTVLSAGTAPDETNLRLLAKLAELIRRAFGENEDTKPDGGDGVDGLSDVAKGLLGVE